MTAAITQRNAFAAMVRRLLAALGAGSSAIEETRLDAFLRRPVAVLSPHFDDACFSLGCFLARLETGHLINVFTQGRHIARESLKAAASDQTTVFHIRDGEDAGFAGICRMTRHDLGCEEPLLRDRRPSDLSGLRDDQEQIRQPILDCLLQLARAQAPGARPVLFAPLGVGGHVNHRAVAATVMELLPQLSPHFDIFFYEELPYSSSLMSRLHAVRRAGAATVLKTRFIYRTRWNAKRELLSFYASQFRGRPRPAAFRPTAPFTPFLHEAFWSVQKG